MGWGQFRSPISLSLLAHALFFLACAALISERASHRRQPELAWVELVRPEKKRRTAEDSERHRQQIVQTETGKKADRAAPDAFLGERTQTVDRQTVSKSRRVSIGQAPAATKPDPAGKAAEKPADTKAQDLTKTGPLSAFGVPILSHLKKLSETEPRPEPVWSTPGQLTEDYVKGLRESERTALNTREYVFFGYYQRIRERLDRAWVPLLRERLVKYYRTGRHLASDMDHTTRVLVVLNGGGEIVRVQVVSESGSRDLDDAAIRAFNQAGPFPNPPRGIIDPNGEIQVPWEFVLRT